MRGKPIGKNERNIPAYAGKTGHAEHLTQQAREHPRVCGENSLPRVPHRNCPGTSPRMRGKPGLPRPGQQLIRNIPAYAGKTGILENASSHASEHPRVCGENLTIVSTSPPMRGTSPRMRGKLFTTSMLTGAIRNIPAYAGKTKHTCHNAHVSAEHPRVCGENHRVKLAREVAEGTSPRMRGKRRFTMTGSLIVRNIPAYAGKTAEIPATPPG